MSNAIVVTTIFEPAFLDGYVGNLVRFDRVDSARIIVIPDRKTPASVFDACLAVKARGIDVVCPSLDEQGAFLRKLSAPPDWIPFDSDNRRNIGFMMALADGCDRVISIDDDNYCPAAVDFVAAHAVAGEEITVGVRSSSDGWLNVCDELAFKHRGQSSFPRGFPYASRQEARRVTRVEQRVKIAVNAGLWTDDPDVDAVSRLADRPKVTAYTGEPFALSPDTWSPVNTQNTAVSRDAMAAYYYVRMGFPVQGLKIDRYGDILSGYFAQKCIRHLGEAVRFGDPICEHVRTPHNLFKDLYHELAGMVIVEELLPWLIDVRLSGATYQESYASLADELHAAASTFQGFVFDEGGRDFLRSTATNMKTWTRALAVIGD